MPKASAIAVHAEVLEVPAQSPAERGVLVLERPEAVPVQWTGEH
jgi:hypothetical protein